MTDLNALYVDLHRNPELSFAEHRTARVLAGLLRKAGYSVTEGIGGTGVVGVLENGEGPTVLLRADMDGLPVREQTGLEYASTVAAVGDDGVEVPVMHACGHDVHMVCLIGAAERLAQTRERWSGTVVALFQPAEELGTGALAMIGDPEWGSVPKPDVVMGQHVIPLPAGMIGLRSGPVMTAADGMKVRLPGIGGHGSSPAGTVDPVVMAAATVMRLQSIVSREVNGSEYGVITVGQISAGTRNNIIPDEATLGLTVRTVEQAVRERLLTAIERIVAAEALASGAPSNPEISRMGEFPLTVNEKSASGRVARVFRERLGEERVIDAGLMPASEDVSHFAETAGVPLVFWFLGGFEPSSFPPAPSASSVPEGLPANHSPFFAPIPEPTISTGVDALEAAAMEWLETAASTAR